MLPNLRHLALCPTSSNNYEAGGSNDPLPSADDSEEEGESEEESEDSEDSYDLGDIGPDARPLPESPKPVVPWLPPALRWPGYPNPMPPPPPRPEPPDRYPSRTEVLGTADLVNAILTALSDGDAEEACIAAINWCDLSKAHKGMCNDEDAWEQLARAIFADANGNFPIAHPGGRWEEYFRMLCEHLVAQRRAEEAAERRRIEGIAETNRELANRSIRKYKESLEARMYRHEDLAEQYRRAKQEGVRGEREAEIIELMGEAEALMQQAADSGRAVRNEIRQVVDALDKLWNMQGAMGSGAFWRPTPAQTALQRAMQVLRRAMEREEITETFPAEAVTSDDDSD